MEKLKTTNDVIAAIATAPGRGGIGVIRLSGPDLGPFVLGLTGRTLQPRLATHTPFLDSEQRVLDDGIAIFFAAPASYTGEEVLELQGHGGDVVLRLVLQRCLDMGARLAEPGEFTRRAYLNDKLDLAQAEAVADLIEASTASAARSAVRSLTGEFSRKVAEVQERLTGLRVLVEAVLDFPEEELDALKAADATGRLSRLVSLTHTLRAQAGQGALLRTGLHVVLAGSPNVGKSSLLNALTGQDRAIVTELPGTTRDVLRETIQVSGIPLHIIDTAGLRETDDAVEKIGISRTWAEIERADVLLQIEDARHPDPHAHHLTNLPERLPRIIIRNKTDLLGLPAERSDSNAGPVIRLSAKTGEGMDLLRAELLRVAGWSDSGEDVFLARERHLRALDQALAHLALAAESLGQIELCAEELRLAQRDLGTLTGEFSADDLLGEIFSRFCIGK